MIIKGNRHNNGAKLARYITTGEQGERAELAALRGFVSDDIFKAFRSVHVMAAASEIENPFFHVQVRLPDGEQITREQWDRTADATRNRLGLSGQPYAITFHIDEMTGERHMHMAVSLIDAETLKAKPVPFFKYRLKALARELEKEFDITRVKNVREGPIKYAAKKNEQQQAQRLGTDKDAIRNTIRASFDQSNSWPAFEAALAHEGMVLSQGDRRNLVVVDHAGGVHAFGKRLLDVNKAQILQRLAGLDVNELPSVQQAQEFVRENSRERQQQPDKLDRLKAELAEVQELQAEAAAQQHQREKPAPLWDRDRANTAWENAVMNAAIAKEKRERQFVEPKERETRAGREQAKTGGRKEKHWPVNPPQPERKSPELFGKAATEAGRDDRMENLTGPAAQVWQAWQHSDSAQAYAAALDEKGITFAKATHDEAYRSNREADFAKEINNRGQRLKEGEIVIVTEARPEYRRNGELTERSRVYKLDQSLAYKFVKGLDGLDKLQGIDATIKTSDQRAQQRAADWEAIRLERATNTNRSARPLPARAIATAIAKGPLTVAAKAPAVLKPVTMGLNLIGKPLEILGNLFEPPVLTPEQKRAGEIASRERQAEGRDQIEHSNTVAERAQERRQEEEREAARQREERERYGGGRER